MKLNPRFALCCGVAASALLFVHQAGAFTITAEQGVVTTTQQLGAGEVGTVEPGGTINAPGNGIEATDNGVTVDNAGSVTGGSSGISVLGNNTITNSGTADGGVFSILAIGDDNTITNAGTATGGTFGIIAFGSGNTITNSGTADGGAYGIFADGDGNTITNSGTADGGDYGIFAVGNGNTITNAGTATDGIFGIFAFGNGNTITNAGTADGGGAYGIIAEGNNNTVTNSGKIIGGTSAVLFIGGDNTLELLAGSNIQGSLDLGGSSNTLIIGRGLDTALAFTDSPTIKTNGVPFVVIDNTVYAVNVTAFSVQDEMTNDLTRAVTGAVEGRLASARRTGGGLSMAMNGMTIAAAADVSVAPQNGLWLSGLAAYRDQEENGDVASFESGLTGVVGGIDGMVTDTTRAGLFGGFSAASLVAEDDALEDLDSDSWFGGVYLGHEWGQAFVDLTLTAGWSDFDSSRRVANNMVAGGIEHAEADYGGFLLSPSVRIGTDMAMGSGTFTPSLRLRYAGLFLESYEESGSAAALEVNERNINVFDVRGELAYGFATGNLQSTLRVGIDGTLSNADDAEATLAGQALDIDVADESLARGFLGYDADYALSDSASLTFAAEAGYDTTEAVTLEARAGFSWTF